MSTPARAGLEKERERASGPEVGDVPLVNPRSLSCLHSKVAQNDTVYGDLDLGSVLLRGSIHIDKKQQAERPKSHRAKSPTTHQAVESEHEREWY